jgi:predicted nucleic acid-binding protein
MSQLVYPDTNIYFRPFDNWLNTRIALEAEACLLFWNRVSSKQITCLSSVLIELEINKAPSLKKKQVQKFLTLVSKSFHLDDNVKELSQILQKKFRIPPYDAVHLAFALEGKVDIFITCDDDILKKSLRLEKWLESEGFHLLIMNPIQWNHFN